MSNEVAAVVNEALDAAAVKFSIGDIQEGTDAANAALRHYGQCLRQLLRAVHWDFARKQQDMLLLADATGQTTGAGTIVPKPWVYEYAYPPDCMKARFLPRNYFNATAAPAGNTALPDVPLTSASITPMGCGMRLVPAPFLIMLDTNYAVPPDSNWMETQGASPGGRVVILTNVKQAQLVYTGFMPYPSVWDGQFRAAMVGFLASKLAMPLSANVEIGMKMRDLNIKIAADKVMAARVTNGNESSFPQTIDHLPDWMSIRAAGNGYGGNPWSGSWGPWGAGGYGFDGCGFMGYGFDNSVF